MGQKDVLKNLARFMNVYEVFTETGSCFLSWSTKGSTVSIESNLFIYTRDGPLENLSGGGGAEVQNKYSRKVILNEKKFTHAN